jgi:hypothetical protein
MASVRQSTQKPAPAARRAAGTGCCVYCRPEIGNRPGIAKTDPSQITRLGARHSSLARCWKASPQTFTLDDGHNRKPPVRINGAFAPESPILLHRRDQGQQINDLGNPWVTGHSKTRGSKCPALVERFQCSPLPAGLHTSMISGSRENQIFMVVRHSPNVPNKNDTAPQMPFQGPIFLRPRTPEAKSHRSTMQDADARHARCRNLLALPSLYKVYRCPRNGGP